MSASRGRYQSRVLSFLSQQSMQWRDRTLRSVRQARLTLTWGIQVVLYPIYVLFQSGRLLGQQIRAAVDRLMPLLEAVKDDAFDPAVGVPPLDVDQPVYRILDYLETFQLPIIISPRVLPKAKSLEALAGAVGDGKVLGEGGVAADEGAIAPVSLPMQVHQDIPGADGVMVQTVETQPIYLTQVVRGFASMIDTRCLVLVDVQNQILDILTTEQQLHLSQRIVWEVADYYRHHKLQLRAQTQSRWRRSLSGMIGKGAWRFLPPPQETPAMVAPVRVFNRIMGWMQTSAIAVSANVFQESALVHLSHPQAPSPLPMTEPVPRQIIGADHGVPMRSPFWQGMLQWLGVPSGSAIQPVSHKPGIPRTSVNRPNFSNTPHWFDPDRQDSADGWFSANQLNQLRRQAGRFFTVPSLPFRNPWMGSWDDDGIQSNDAIVDSPGQSPTPDRMTEPGAIAPSNTQRLTQASFTRRSTAYSVSASDDGLLSAGQRHQTHDAGDLFASIDPAEQDGALSSTLVDTKATLVGYVKHPLEQVLEWIDLGMLWLEDMASKAWHWLKIALKSK